MRTLSVKEYAQEKGMTVQGVRKQIRENRLPEGVTAQQVGSFYMLKVEE